MKKSKFEIVLELYKKEHITAEECSTLMEKEKETVYIGYPSFYNPYPQTLKDLPYYTSTNDNSFSTINDKP